MCACVRVCVGPCACWCWSVCVLVLVRVRVCVHVCWCACACVCVSVCMCVCVGACEVCVGVCLLLYSLRMSGQLAEERLLKRQPKRCPVALQGSRTIGQRRCTLSCCGWCEVGEADCFSKIRRGCPRHRCGRRNPSIGAHNRATVHACG